MAIYEQFDVDPAKNNKTPPYGAPEKGLSFDLITDTLRVVMAAIAEIGKLASSSAGAIGTLGKQNANAVQITGGTVDGVTLTRTTIGWSETMANTIDPFAIFHATHKINVNMLPLQALYNMVHPVGTIRLSINSSASDLKWAGTTSTWRVVPSSGDRYLVSAGTLTGGGAGAGAFAINKVLPFAGPPDGAGNFVQSYQPGASQLTGVYQDPTRYGFHVLQRTA
jgi:hypothetical protein